MSEKTERAVRLRSILRWLHRSADPRDDAWDTVDFLHAAIHEIEKLRARVKQLEQMMPNTLLSTHEVSDE